MRNDWPIYDKDNKEGTNGVSRKGQCGGSHRSVGPTQQFNGQACTPLKSTDYIDFDII